MMHRVILFTIFVECISFCLADLIWQKDIGNFVPVNISSRPRTKNALQERAKTLESHRFNGELIKLAYYQENYLIDFRDDDTRVSGVCGEIWNILADYLNFTLLPVKVSEEMFGHKLQNGTFTGLLGLMQKREVHVLPRVNFFRSHREIMDYTMPLWKNNFQLYNRPEYKSNESWVFKLFTFKAWITVTAMMGLISILGTIAGKITSRLYYQQHYWTFQDYFFYTFSTACSQGWMPKNLEEECKILELSKRIFSWFLLITISSHLVSYMTNTKMQPPFNGINSLLNSTKYNVLIFNGSLAYEYVKLEMNRHPAYAHRFIPMGSSKEMREKVCWSKKKYTLIGSEDKQSASKSESCNLIRTGAPLFATWTTSGIVKGYKYKRAFDIGVLRLHETGLLDGIKDHWLQIKSNDQVDQAAESIKFYHVYMLFVFLLMGAVLSAIICVVERIFYPWKRYYNQKKKLMKFQRRLQAQSFLITRKKFRPLMKY